MSESILSLAKKFIALESTVANPTARRKVLQLAFSQLGDFTIERFEHNGVASALVYAAKQRPKKFKILLNGHLDVVPGRKENYRARIQGDRLYGVGSMDMKANVAALIAVFKDVARQLPYDLGLQLVTDEEVGGFSGTKHQIEEGVRAHFVIAGEPTNFDIVSRAKGILQLTITASGKTAHGAYPWRGDNAIWKMNNFLAKLHKKFPIPEKEAWATTLNLSTISTNNRSFNKIPDECSVGLDIRYVPGDGPKTLRTIQKILPKGLHMKVAANEPAMEVDTDSRYIQLLCKAGVAVTNGPITVRGANGSSDARHFARIGTPGVEFGPVGGEIGEDNEWVSISSLEKYYRIMQKFLLSIRN